MSQPEAGPSAALAATAADPKLQKPKGQQPNKAQQQNKAAADNRSKAQQNKERAAQGRARKAQNVTFTEEGLAAQDGTATASTSDTVATAAKQPKKQVKKDASKPQAARQAKTATQFKSKVVIRRLPPNLPEDVFWKAVSPWIRDKADCQALAAAAAAPTQTSSESTQVEASASSTPPQNSVTPTVDYKKFVAGKLKTDANKQNKHARAYVRFLNPQSLVAFHKAFDGHIFRDSKGKESVAIVEFAPYQKVVLPPSSSSGGQRGRRAKPDPKQGTIDKDADYLAFVERLDKAVGDDSVKRSEGELLASLHDPKGREKEREAKQEAGKATPLLQHLRAVKMAKLESAAAIKKAKKLEKAAAKAAAGKPVGSAAAKSGVAEDKGKAKKSKKKEKAKEKAKSAVAGGDSLKPDEAAKERSAKKDRNRKRKPKPSGDADAGIDGNGANNVKAGSNIKPGAKAASSAEAAQGDGASKGSKAKSKPPRRGKGGPKDKPKSSSTGDTNSAAAQPAKIQIFKRES